MSPTDPDSPADGRRPAATPSPADGRRPAATTSATSSSPTTPDRTYIKRPRAAASDAPRPPFFVLALGSALGTGYAPVASGTVGSAFAVALWWFIPGFDHPVFLASTILLTLLAGIPAAAAMERLYGEDPSQVVIDEVVGQWIALLFLPKTLLAAALAFAAFRAFDILKPPPVRQLDAMHGGTGIMLDDVAAGCYALAVVHLALLVL